jgi:predicted acyl esterase
VPECRVPVAIAHAQRVTYRIPLVPNARRIVPDHRLRLVLASAHETNKEMAITGFTHTTVREASVNGVYSVSRLLLPLVSSAARRARHSDFGLERFRYAASMALWLTKHQPCP